MVRFNQSGAPTPHINLIRPTINLPNKKPLGLYAEGFEYCLGRLW